MSYELRITDYGLRITDYGLRITDYGLRITDYGLRITDYGLRVTGYEWVYYSLPTTIYYLPSTIYHFPTLHFSLFTTMSGKTNPVFTHSELALMENSDLFYQKRQIIHKMTDLLGQTADALKQLPEHKAFTFPEHTDITAGKISKGENYLQLPWLMLDFPRLFKPDSIFAYRIMFWWGNGFYLTLHLAGNALHHFEPVLLNNCHQLGNDPNLWFCTGNNPWQHQPDTQNYLPARQLTARHITHQITQHRFVKLTQSLHLTHHSKLKHHALQRYQFFLALLSN